jgi:inorganic pyrophosphatase
MLSKILPQGMVFPFDFGFVPSTRGGDGDPLDVLVLIEEATFPGCLLECSLIGVPEATQQERNAESIRNDRLIATARQSLLYSEVTDVRDLQGSVLKYIEGFFVNYQRLRDVEFSVLGYGGPSRAREILHAARSNNWAA